MVDTDAIVGAGVAIGIAGMGLALMSKVMKTTAKTTKKGGSLLFGGFQKTKGTLKW